MVRGILFKKNNLDNNSFSSPNFFIMYIGIYKPKVCMSKIFVVIFMIMWWAALGKQFLY